MSMPSTKPMNSDAGIAADTDASRNRGVTVRSIVYGLLLSVAIGILGDTVRYILHASFMAYSHMPMGNLILTLLSIIFCSMLAYRFGRRFLFSSSEWITIFCMGFISSLGPTYGISGYLVGIMVAPHYFVTQENEWARYLHPYLPGWLIPENEGNAMAWFYEGLPQGASIPWGVWAVPLFWWFTFLCAVAFAVACLSIIFRKQWSEYERLVFPAMEPIIEFTTQGGTGRRWFPEFMKGKVFWAGFMLTTFVFGWNMIAWFYPQFPRFPTASARWFFFSRDYPPGFFFLSTVVICFSYFASLEILFSLWFFDVLFILEGGILSGFGVSAISPYYGRGRYIWQTAGGFTAFALWAMWVARHHLRDVIRKAVNPDRPTPDDSNELLSYRHAVIGLIAGCLYMALWLAWIGMQVKIIVLLILCMLFVYTTVSKMLADSGIVYLNPPTSAWGLVSRFLGGSHTFTAHTKMALSMSSRAVNHYRGLSMGTMTHINRLAEFLPAGKRRLFGAVCAAFVVGMVTSTFYTVWLGYTMGGYNIQPNWLIIHAGVRQIQGIANSIKAVDSPIEPVNYWFFFAGAAVMALLNLMRYRFVWWPLHPIGFALSGTALSRLTSATIFVAWLVKLSMLKLAGAAFYRKSRPFFIGMLVGYILSVAAGVVVDAIWFQPDGHVVHKWY